MMYNYYRRYYPYYPMQYPYDKRPDNCYLEKKETVQKTCDEKQKKEGHSAIRTPSSFNFLNNFFHQDDRDGDEALFDLFGIKLYHDDILLLSLIFFLYKEDVKDQYLFFALILLLLS